MCATDSITAPISTKSTADSAQPPTTSPGAVTAAGGYYVSVTTITKMLTPTETTAIRSPAVLRIRHDHNEDAHAYRNHGHQVARGVTYPSRP